MSVLASSVRVSYVCFKVNHKNLQTLSRASSCMIFHGMWWENKFSAWRKIRRVSNRCLWMNIPTIKLMWLETHLVVKRLAEVFHLQNKMNAVSAADSCSHYRLGSLSLWDFPSLQKYHLTQHVHGALQNLSAYKVVTYFKLSLSYTGNALPLNASQTHLSCALPADLQDRRLWHDSANLSRYRQINNLFSQEFQSAGLQERTIKQLFRQRDFFNFLI